MWKKRIIYLYKRTNDPIMSSKEILLVHYGGEAAPFLPLGTLYVASSLRRAGYQLRLVSSDITEDEFESLLADTEPLYVGFSVFTFPQIHQMIRLSTLVKEAGCLSVWGGHHPTVLAEQCINEPFVDYVLRGEGEEVCVELSGQLAKGLLRNKMILNAPRTITNLDEFQPALDLVDLNAYVSTLQNHLMQRYGHLKNLGYLSTSRGCTSRCKFCGVHNIYDNGKKYGRNAHSVEFVKEQLRYIRSQIPDLESIIIWDDNFFERNSFDERSKKILTFLKEEGLRFNIEARAMFLKRRENVRLLKEMGCLQVFIGAESGSQQVLRLMRKGTKVSDYMIVIDNCVAEDLPLRMSFFYGYPGETLEDITETKKLLALIGSYGPGISVSGPKIYRPVPGTEGFKEAVRLGFIVPQNTIGWAKINSNTDPELLPWLVNEAQRAGVDSADIYEWLGIRMNG